MTVENIKPSQHHLFQQYELYDLKIEINGTFRLLLAKPKNILSDGQMIAKQIRQGLIKIMEDSKKTPAMLPNIKIGTN